VTPEIASLFQSWLTAYQRSFRALGTLGLERKRQRHLDRVVELAGTHGSITRQELRLIMRMSAAQIDKYTHELVANGRLRRIGDHSEGRYGKA
jgi:predicted HTH transcriptional regulator